MKQVIDLYQDVVIQIATPYSKGTGFYLQNHNLIITNEHVIRGNKEVVIDGSGFKRQLAKVLYTDAKYDLAFLEVPDDYEMPKVSMGLAKQISIGDKIIVVGHPFGLKFSATQGMISNTEQEQNDLLYIHHDAALNPGNSGGPLVNEKGEVVGVNTFIIQNGNNVGFSLPVSYLKESIEGFKAHNRLIGTRCNSCSNQVFEDNIDKKYCPHCGAKVELPSAVEEYEPTGVPKTIEALLKRLNYNVQLSRRGPNNWDIQKGSAHIEISYHEKTGLIIGDAHLLSIAKRTKPNQGTLCFFTKAKLYH